MIQRHNLLDLLNSKGARLCVIVLCTFFLLYSILWLLAVNYLKIQIAHELKSFKNISYEKIRINGYPYRFGLKVKKVSFKNFASENKERYDLMFPYIKFSSNLLFNNFKIKISNKGLLKFPNVEYYLRFNHEPVVVANLNSTLITSKKSKEKKIKNHQFLYELISRLDYVYYKDDGFVINATDNTSIRSDYANKFVLYKNTMNKDHILKFITDYKLAIIEQNNHEHRVNLDNDIDFVFNLLEHKKSYEALNTVINNLSIKGDLLEISLEQVSANKPNNFYVTVRKFPNLLKYLKENTGQGHLTALEIMKKIVPNLDDSSDIISFIVINQKDGIIIGESKFIDIIENFKS